MDATGNRISGCLFYVSSPREVKEEPVEIVKPEVTRLTRQMVQGNEDAWVHFHSEYSPRLFRYLLVLLRGDEDLAAELLQVTFTKIARHIRLFTEEIVLWHWCARIARTVTIDELRKRGRQSACLEEMEGSAQAASIDHNATQFLPSPDQFGIHSFFTHACRR